MESLALQYNIVSADVKRFVAYGEAWPLSQIIMTFKLI